MRRQQGFVAVLVGIAIVAMVAMTGLALDLGKLFVAKSELQNSADACALAAAQELTGANANQLELAEAAGIAVGSRHKVLFQDAAVSLTANNSVTFSPDNSGGSYVSRSGLSGATALSMRYARCTVARANISTWFIQVVNSLPGAPVGQQVSAAAVATLKPSQTTCALPAAICSTAMTPEPAIGTWLSAAIGPPGGQGLSGNFNWIDFTPPNGGAAELAEQILGGGACALPAQGVPVGQAGNVSSIAKDYNTRFGIYQGSLSEADAPPDFSGYAYTDVNWDVSAGNAFPDFRDQRASNTPYQTDALTGLKTQGAIRNAAALRTYGQDRRLMIAPVVDCSGFTTGQTAPIVSWACVFLLHPISNNAGSGSGGGGGNGNGNGNSNGNSNGNGGGGSGGGGATAGTTRMYLEYRGNAKDANSPCASYGLPGGANNTGPLVATLVK